MRTIVSLLLVLAAWSCTPSTAAAAKSKTEVAANCLSQSQARRAWPASSLRYRSVDGGHCWYAPGKPMLAKRHEPKHETKRAPVRLAAVTAVPVSLPAVVEAPSLDRVKAALCGGPCPRFDLDEPVFHALCGGLCPSFRPAVRIDNAFEAFGMAR